MFTATLSNDVLRSGEVLSPQSHVYSHSEQRCASLRGSLSGEWSELVAIGWFGTPFDALSNRIWKISGYNQAAQKPLKWWNKFRKPNGLKSRKSNSLRGIV